MTSPRLLQRATRYALATALAGLVAGGCGETGSTAPVLADGPTFVIDVVGEQFKVRVNDEATRTLLRQHLASGRVGVLHGMLVRGNGGFNGPHQWHLDPATITTPDVAIEVCDGRPSDIDKDLPYWLGNVRAYCPWGAQVIREEE